MDRTAARADAGNAIPYATDRETLRRNAGARTEASHLFAAGGARGRREREQRRVIWADGGRERAAVITPGDKSGDPYGVRGTPAEELPRVHHDLKTGLSFTTCASPARVPVTDHVDAVAGELNRRTGSPGEGRGRP